MNNKMEFFDQLYCKHQYRILTGFIIFAFSLLIYFAMKGWQVSHPYENGITIIFGVLYVAFLGGLAGSLLYVVLIDIVTHVIKGLHFLLNILIKESEE